MSSLRFDWDPKKARANLKDHGVSFEEAQSTFYDEWAILYDDPDHTKDEAMADETGVPYQTLINLYLRDCAINERKLAMEWRVADA